MVFLHLRMITQLNVYDATMARLKMIFDHFEYVYVSFSGGKDSGLLLNMAIEYIRRYAPGRRLGVFHMDYEIQYRHTTEYVQRTWEQNRDILDIYHCCVPFKVSTCTSMYQDFWRPWDPKMKNLWVRELPRNAYTEKDFSFYTQGQRDYDFQFLFATWLRVKKNYSSVCCLVGIRTQESINRWRTIHSDNNYRHWQGCKWTREIDKQVYNAYPIYDWETEDVWAAYGKFGWDYNRLYDLYWKAGIPLARQRVASPFISEAISYLGVYRAIDPDTWGKMISRVNGVNFSGMYGNTTAMGWRSINCPPGKTWKEYMYFLLDTLPDEIRNNYLSKLEVSRRFWRTKGGVLADETIQKLRDAGIEFTIGKDTSYKTNKKPVMMEYIEDIDIPEFREIPSYKRMCICILKNDHACKYMGFAITKKEKEMRERVMKKYKALKNGRI